MMEIPRLLLAADSARVARFGALAGAFGGGRGGVVLEFIGIFVATPLLGGSRAGI